MAQFGNFVLDKGFRAAAALTKFRAVKLSAEDTVTPCTAVGDKIMGFAQFSISAAELAKGKGASVRMVGLTEAETSAAVSLGDLCELVSDGRVRAATAASGARIVGRCVAQASGGAGERIVLLVEVNGGTVGTAGAVSI